MENGIKMQGLQKKLRSIINVPIYIGVSLIGIFARTTRPFKKLSGIQRSNYEIPDKETPNIK
jgi:hypothetical protein